jgi:CubicO group peptidase (beta-lactamase class C family)
MLLNKGTVNGQRMLGRKTVEAMTRNQLHNIPAPYHWGNHLPIKPYGLGCLVVPEGFLQSPGTFGHEGAGWSGLLIDPQEEFTLAYMQPCGFDGFTHRTMIGVKTLAWGGLL